MQDENKREIQMKEREKEMGRDSFVRNQWERDTEGRF